MASGNTFKALMDWLQCNPPLLPKVQLPLNPTLHGGRVTITAGLLYEAV